MRKLISGEGGNENILVPAMYLHDIGYHGLIKDNRSLENRLKAKKKHMKRGARMAKKILSDTGGFSNSEIKKICYLVETHDILDMKRVKDEQLVLEADSLAMFDRKRVPVTISKKEFTRLKGLWREKRIPGFRTKTGKRLLKKFI
jgi:HD superfamily phosphodiesterase